MNGAGPGDTMPPRLWERAKAGDERAIAACLAWLKIQATLLGLHLDVARATRTRQAGRLRRFDIGRFWFVRGPEPVCRRAPSVTLRVAGRQVTLGVRL